MVSYGYKASENQKRRALLQRMTIVHGAFLLVLLVIVARLIELQIVHGESYRQDAERQHAGKIPLPARRGEIFSVNSKTGETNILATNTTLDMVYVDPLITDDPGVVADTLANILLTE